MTKFYILFLIPFIVIACQHDNSRAPKISSTQSFKKYSNTQKAFSTAPIVFYPEFYKKISFTKNLRMRHFAHYTFRGEIKVSTILIRDLFKFFTIPVEPIAILKIA